MQKAGSSKQIRPSQSQSRPGQESRMKPQPIYDDSQIKGSGKLLNKIAFITGGDSGIGRAVAVLFAKEGADVAIIYLNESADAKETKLVVENDYGRRCLLIKADISKEKNCSAAVKQCLRIYKKIDILVNNAGMHYEHKDITTLPTSELIKTFETNIYSMFWLTKFIVPSMKKGSCIINTSSVTAYRGSPDLLDYSSTKGAIVSFTRSLSANLIKKGIRVNGVAPGPIWTPLIPASFDGKKAAKHGSDVPIERAGEPVEIAPCYLFLASSDSSYMTGQFLHPNGGEIVNG